MAQLAMVTISTDPPPRSGDQLRPPVPEVRTSRVAGFGGLSLAVQEQGSTSDPTVVLVHGYPDDHGVWSLVAERLAVDHHVVTYDVRGAGESEVPDNRAGYAIEALVADLDAVIAATSPDRPVHLVGHDWGSIQSWSAVTDPEVGKRFASFTSISGPGLDHVAAWIRAHRIPGAGRWGRARRQAVRSWYIAAFRTSLAPKVWRGPLASRWPLVVSRAEGAVVDAVWPGPHLADNGARGVELYRANMYGRKAPEVPPATEVPVQLIVPVGDRYVTPGLLRGMEAVAPNLVRREVGGGHWIPRSKPDLVARLVAEHVAAVEADRLPEPAPDGDVVVVTGAGSGIGRSVCLAFAGRGAHIIATDLRADTAARTAELCRQLGATAESHVLDVTDGAAFDQLAAAIGVEHGAPSIVVNNAGLGMAGSFLDTTEEDWDLLLDVNLRGVIRGSRSFGRLMVDEGRIGHIVNIASAAAYTPSRTLPAYATSKAAVLMLTECLRAELASDGIGVSAICPGFVDTGIATATRYVGVTDAEQDARRRSADRMYKRRRVTPDAVADAVLRAVDGDRPLVPVAIEARLGLFAQRFTPRLRRALARIDLTPSVPAPGSEGNLP